MPATPMGVRIQRMLAAWSRFVDRIAALSEPRWILYLVLLATAACLVWTVPVSSRQIQFDEVHYDRHAHDLAAGRGYIDENGEPSAYWPVGYPLALAGGYTVFGYGKLVGFGLQILASVGTCVLISFLGTAAFGSAIGRSAALLLAFYPTHIFYSTLQLTEPLFTLILTGALWLTLRSLVSFKAALIAGILFGLAMLVRPAAVLLPAFLFLWYWHQGLRLKAVLLTAVMGCAALACISPWLVRSHSITGRWTDLSTSGGHNFWVGNYPGAFGGYARTEIAMNPLRDGSRMDYQRGYQLGFESILKDPVEAAARTFRKATYFFALETDGVLWNLKGFAREPAMPVTLALLAVANLPYVAALVLCIPALLTSGSSSPLRSLFLFVTGYFVLISLAFFGDPRYHYALIPFAVIFASKTLYRDLAGILESRNRRILIPWAALVAGFLVLMAANLAIKAAEMKALGS